MWLPIEFLTFLKWGFLARKLWVTTYLTYVTLILLFFVFLTEFFSIHRRCREWRRLSVAPSYFSESSKEKNSALSKQKAKLDQHVIKIWYSIETLTLPISSALKYWQKRRQQQHRDQYWRRVTLSRVVRRAGELSSAIIHVNRVRRFNTYS